MNRIGLAVVLAFAAGPAAGAPSLEEAFGTAQAALVGRPTAGGADLAPFTGEEVGGNPVRTYGVIINGDSAGHHTANVDRFYRHLRSHYGVPSSDITVVSTHRGYPSDLRGVEHAARMVAWKADANDRVVIYTTGHGGRWAGMTHLALMGDTAVSDRDFAAAFLGNSAAHVTYIGDQCYSGGFVDALTSGERDVLAISASDAFNTTYCQSFINPYLDAFKDARNDSDGNGSVDEREAFAAAAPRHRRERPAGQGNGQFRESGLTAAGRRRSRASGGGR